MALPTAYLTRTKNLGSILDAMQSAQAPEKFTTRFLVKLGFASAADRTVIGVLKSLGFLDTDGKPTDRYFRFLDQAQSKKVLAEGIQEAYADLFKIRTDAEKLSPTDFTGKIKTLSQGSLSDSVLKKHTTTFSALVKLADFSEQQPRPPENTSGDPEDPDLNVASGPNAATQTAPQNMHSGALGLGGLHYNIQIILPSTRDAAVYDAIFRSLKDHLIE